MALHYLGRLEKHRRVKSDDPLRAIFAEWLKLADFHYMRPRWQGHSEADMASVATYVRQAYEYHVASKNTSLLTRPVLIYYSLLNLTKALLFLKTDQTPPNHHGLCKPKMADTLLGVAAETNRGVFIDLGGLFNAQIKTGRRLSLEDLVWNCIELREAYRDYFLATSPIIAPDVDIRIDGDITVTFRPTNAPDFAPKKFQRLLQESTRLYDDFKEIQSSPCIILKTQLPAAELETNGAELLAKHFQFSVFPDANYYLNLNPEDKRLPPAVAYLGVMFLLSSLVRYSPGDLNRFLTDSTTSVSWFFQTLCDVSERVYPNILLNALLGSDLKFAPSFAW